MFRNKVFRLVVRMTSCTSLVQDVPFALCVELHPHRVVQIVPLELPFAHVLEHSQNPCGVSSHCPSYCHSSVTSQASPRLQTWERQDQFHSNAKVKESDEAMESLKKDRKAFDGFLP